MLAHINLILKHFLSYLPSRLPVGLTEFEEWCDSIIELGGLPATRDSQVQALANMLIHASPKSTEAARSHMTKRWFVKGLIKGAANQIASYRFYEIQKAFDEKRKQYATEADRIGAELKTQVEEVTGQNIGEATAKKEAVNESRQETQS